MEVIYTIHNNPEHCHALINNKEHSYSSIRKLINERARDYLKKNKSIKKTNSINFEDVAGEFKKSSLTKDEIAEYFFNQKQSKAKSWFSSLRRKRKKGKLEKHKVDALNKRGMLWNPRTDEWEKNYLTFKNNPLIGILKEMRKKNYYVRRKELTAVIKKDNWIIEQSKLNDNEKLSEENKFRLNAINFQFNSLNNHSYSANITKLIDIVLTIDELREMGAKNVADRYNLNQKVYLGGSVKISDSILEKIHKEEMDKYERLSKIDDKYLVMAEKEHSLDEKKAINILKEKPTEYFIKQIDKLAKKRGSNLWSSFTRHNVNYSHINNYLTNNFDFPRTKINNVVYNATYGKFNYDDDIKIYAAKKMVEILDKYLLKTGHLNDKKTFRPVSFLMNLYKKNKNIEGLIYLKGIIEKHQLLTLIYSDRLNKIISKYV
jgi:hypothetical protein